MEGFLGTKLAQTSGNILGGSSPQKPVSSYQFKLPELSSSFYSIADEPFPQVSGFLDDTVSPSFISKEASVLKTPACTQSENRTKNEDGVTSDSGLNILGGSSFQKPVSIYQIKLPELSSSFCLIADEQFPQVSGFLDDTVSPSCVSNKPSVLSTPACTQSENRTRNEEEGVTSGSELNFSLGVQSNWAGGSTSRSLQNDKDIVNITADAETAASLRSVTFLEKPDLMSINQKISTFDVTQDLKETSDPVNLTVDLQSIKEKNSTFDLTKDLKEHSKTDATDDLENIKERSGAVDLTQNVKERFDSISNSIVNVQNMKEKNSTFDLTQDSKKPSDTNIVVTIDLPDFKEKNSSNVLTQELKKTPDICNNLSVDLQNIKEKNSTFDLTQDLKKMPVAGINTNANLQNSKNKNNTFDQTQDSKEQSDTGSNATVDLQNISEKKSTFDMGRDSKEQSYTGLNVAVDLHKIKDKNSTFESQEPKENLDHRSNSTVDVDVSNVKTESGNATVDLVQSQDLKEGPDTVVNATVENPNVESVHSKAASPVVNCAPLNTTTEMASTPFQQSGDISRNSIFSLDDTLHTRTSFMFTSTPIIFGKESRFDLLRDTKRTPMRKRLSVINSIEVQSNDELVGVSNHEGTEATQGTERSGQKVSTNCTSSHSTSEPANQNKPPTKPPIKRRLPQLSSKLSYPKSSLPLRPQASVDSSAVVKPKVVRGPQTLHPPNTSSNPQLFIKKNLQMNKGRNIAPVKNTVPATTVKTSVISSVAGYNFTAVAKASSSGIHQGKQSALQPPTRKQTAFKMPQSTLASAETGRTQPNNKSKALSGMRTRNSQLPSVGQRCLSNDGSPSAKKKRIAPAAQRTAESDEHPAGARESGCVNCLQHQEKFERVLKELNFLRSECKNWEPFHKKLEMWVEEMKRL